MRALLTPLYELVEYSQIKNALRKAGGAVSVAGCVDAQKWHMAYGLGDGYKFKIIATFSELHAREAYEQFRAFDRNTLLYPAKDLIFYQKRAKNKGEKNFYNFQKNRKIIEKNA